MWFSKKEIKKEQLLTRNELKEMQLKLITQIDALPKDELKQLINEGMIVPDEVKIKLYDFLVEFNLLDAKIDQLYRNYVGRKRSVSSNDKPEKADLNTLFTDKNHVRNNVFENFLINLNVFDISEIRNKIIIIEDSIKLRNRIAHAVPIWHAKGKSVLFYSYDGMFWNTFYKKLRANNNQLYKTPYYRELLTKKQLDSCDFSYVAYHIYQLNFLKEKMKEIRLTLIQKNDLDSTMRV